MDIERRSCTRLPIMLDVIVTIDSKEHKAEVRDISSQGIGLVFTSDIQFPNGDLKVICNFESSDLSLTGSLIREGPPARYRPNSRTVGLKVDPGSSAHLTELVARYSYGKRPKAEFGYLRAWSMLESDDRTSLANFFERLPAGSDAGGIANNLLSDPNCSASRIFNFLSVLGKQALNTEDDPMSLLREAFAIYQRDHALEDLNKDRLIIYECHSPRLTGI